MQQQTTCVCGCGKIPSPGKRYALGHGSVRDPWDRFWSLVVEDAGPSPNGWTGCWTWTGCRRPEGYGVFGFGRRNDFRRFGAHRLAYEWIVGKIPDGLVIDHLCRNRACVNPQHLEPVTDRVNLLRGEGWGGLHARKTHCPAGHLLEGDNLSPYHLRQGQRKCLACHAARQRVRKAKARMAKHDRVKFAPGWTLVSDLPARCDAQPSKRSTARCELPPGHGGNHFGRTAGGYWKGWG